jgi:hypothetical protein
MLLRFREAPMGIMRFIEPEFPTSKFLPTYGFVNKFLHYDPETGILTWKVDQGFAAKGDIAGTPRARARAIIVRLNWEPYSAHRLAWLLTYRKDPDLKRIWHRNGDWTDNRLCNLEIRVKSQPLTKPPNIRKPRSGVPGVIWDGFRGDKWIAMVKVDGKRKSVGRFDTIEEAAAALEVYRASLSEQSQG